MKHKTHPTLLLLACTALLLSPALSRAEAETSPQDDRDWVFAPLVTSSPGFGSGGGAMVMHFYDLSGGDPDTPPSSINAMGMYSDTDSYFTGIFNRSYLRGDRFRVVLGAVHGNVNSDLDIENLGNVEFESTFSSVFFRPEWRVWGDLFAGLSLQYSSVDYTEGNELSATYFDQFGVEDIDSAAIGLILTHDTRDNQFAPTEGSESGLSLVYHPEAEDDQDAYTTFDLYGNIYREITDGHVLAIRGLFRTVSDDAPYSALSTLGQKGGTDLRGYTPGENTAENLLSAQAEYRWHITGKWSTVGFFGLAALYDDSTSDISSDELFPSGGVGLRYLLHEENRLNFRVDLAWGEADQDGVYVGVGEAF